MSFEPISYSHRCAGRGPFAILPGRTCPSCLETAPKGAFGNPELLQEKARKLLLAYAVLSAQDMFEHYANEHQVKAAAAPSAHEAKLRQHKAAVNAGMAKLLGEALTSATLPDKTPAAIHHEATLVYDALKERRAGRVTRQ